MSLPPLVGEAMRTRELHSQAPAHVPIHDVGDRDRAFDLSRQVISHLDILPVEDFGATTELFLVRLVDTLDLLWRVLVTLVGSLFLSIAPLL